MNTLKLLRKKLDMNQIKFAEKLKLSSAAISRIEKGERNLTDRLAMQICSEFGVNEVWLKTGEGDMFVNSSENELIAETVADIINKDDKFMKKVLLTFSKLTPEQREFFNSFIKDLN